MPPEEELAGAEANDFLRTYLADLERGEERTLEDYVAEHPDSADLIRTLWDELHARAASEATAFPSAQVTERLSRAGRQLAARPDSIAELVARACADRSTPAPIDLIDGYELLEEIGRGGQGRVFRARDLRLRREVAIKILPVGASPEELRRLRREGQIAARLDDPGLCKAFDVRECDRGTYVVMQLVPGRSLATCIAECSEAPVLLGPKAADRQNATLHFVEQIARTLDRMHATGVLHRDIKPGNIMVGDDDRPVILDLGLARADEDLTMTRADMLLGTLDYMAPELFVDAAGQQDARTEVWSLGVVLFECLTARRPFVAATRASLTEAIKRGDLPADTFRGWRRDLRAVLETALDRDRDRRYQSAGALADDLARLRRKEPVLARPIGPTLRLWRSAQRRPAAAIALLAVIALPVVWAIEAGIGERRANRYLGETLETLDSVLVKLAGVNLDDMPRGAELRQELLDSAAERYERLAEDERLSTSVERGLASVEVELARLAMEQEELVIALRYVVRARERIGKRLAASPGDVELRREAVVARLRHAAILTRQGAAPRAAGLLATSEAELTELPASDEVRALQIDALMLLADAERRTGQRDRARAALGRAIAVTQEFDPPAHASAAVAHLAIVELHAADDDREALLRALVASEEATQLALDQTPLSRFLMGLYSHQQLYRADTREGDPNDAVVAAHLRRAIDLVTELSSVYPHWRAVDILRWHHNWRRLRFCVATNQSRNAWNLTHDAVADLDALGAKLTESRDLLFVASHMMSMAAAALPASGPFGDAHSLAAERAEALRGEIERRFPGTTVTQVHDEARWLGIVRLSVPHRLNRPAAHEVARPSPTLAITAANGMLELGLRLGREGDGDAAVRTFAAAQTVMAAAYARTPTQIMRRYLYYAMERGTRQLARLGRWKEAVALREASMPHFLAEAAVRNVAAMRNFWIQRGPTQETELLVAPDCTVDPLLRVRFARIIAEALAFLDGDKRMRLADRVVIRQELVTSGRAVLEAAAAAGWRPRQPPSEDEQLRVLYR